MRDPSEFQEIENLGEEEELPEPSGEQRAGGSSALPLLQTALCVLALLALLFLKYTDAETYGKVTDWYQCEAAREIELPQWIGEREESAVTTSSKPQETPITAELDGSLQRV